MRALGHEAIKTVRHEDMKLDTNDIDSSRGKEAQFGNCRIFLSFRFYVKLIFENLAVLNLPFWT